MCIQISCVIITWTAGEATALDPLTGKSPNGPASEEGKADGLKASSAGGKAALLHDDIDGAERQERG